MKLWVDDIRFPPSDEWLHAVSVDQAKLAIQIYLENEDGDLLIDIDHDAGQYVEYGGDYIKLLDWLENSNIVTDKFYFHIHSMNPVGVQNMKNIIQHNNWNLV